MVLTAKFLANPIVILPNIETTVTLRLYSDETVTRGVAIASSGDLRDHVRLGASTSTIAPNQIVDIPVTILVPSSLAAGTYTLNAEVQVAASQQLHSGLESPIQSSTSSEGTTSLTLARSDQCTDDVVLATVAVEVATHSDYAIVLTPPHTRGSSARRHVVRVANTGNVPIELDVSAELVSDEIRIEPDQTTLTVLPGATTESPLLVTPTRRYWGGPTVDHAFVLRATSTAGRTDELAGTYQQRPRVPNWLGPAAAGACAALLIGAVAWFSLLRPWVQDTADQAAADAIEQDRTALRARIDELEAAAAEAEELPLGTPFDIRLDVEPTEGDIEATSASADPGTSISVTDVVFQNPTGAVGTVSLRRDDEVVLQSELANFRDFDLHFVAPYVFGDDVEIVFEVDCRTPGAGQSTCPIGVSLVGFVDESD